MNLVLDCANLWKIFQLAKSRHSDTILFKFYFIKEITCSYLIQLEKRNENELDADDALFI